MGPFLKTKLGGWAGVVLVAVIAVEAFLLVALLTIKDPPPSIAFLTKVGDEYLVIWNESNPRQEPLAKRLPTLKAALRFAKTELNLDARSPDYRHSSLELLWIESTAKQHSLHWKVVGSPYLFRMTFGARPDAETFASAFQRGAYRPSTVGHSIVLSPRAPELANESPYKGFFSQPFLR